MRTILISAFLLGVFISDAQTVTGSWYGIADATNGGNNTNNYLTELVIKQKGNEVEGVFGYYFRTGYQSYFVRGKYNAKTRVLTITDIPVSYFKNRDIDGVVCPMNFSATLMVSKVKSSLNGVFASHERYKYTCPELKVNFYLDGAEKNQDSLIRNNSSKIKKYWQPRNDELVVNTNDVVAAPVFTQEVEKKGVSKDSLDKKIAEEERKKALENLVQAFEQRKTILSNEIEVESDSIRISYYDNGDIDGDSISVFVNKVPVLTHQLLSDRALNMYMAMDSAHPVTEISMYAENLGKYPPNTALMIITDGDKRHEVFLSSSLTQNAAVRIKRKKR
jgi:hypothetical protein